MDERDIAENHSMGSVSNRPRLWKRTMEYLGLVDLPEGGADESEHRGVLARELSPRSLRIIGGFGLTLCAVGVFLGGVDFERTGDISMALLPIVIPSLPVGALSAHMIHQAGLMEGRQQGSNPVE